MNIHAVSDVFFWLGISGIVAVNAMRVVVVLKLRKGYPKIYADIDRPSLIGRMHRFLFKLLDHGDFPAMEKTDRRKVYLFVVLYFLPFVFGFGYLFTLTGES